jgi:hypothetical protein
MSLQNRIAETFLSIPIPVLSVLTPVSRIYLHYNQMLINALK